MVDGDRDLQLRHSADLGRSAAQTQLVVLACPDAMDVARRMGSNWNHGNHCRNGWNH